MQSKPRSLLTRLLLASAGVLPLFLGLSAYMLDLAFQRSLLTAEKERLVSHLYLLLSAAELYGKQLWIPDALTEPRFGQLDSGLYAYVYDVDGRQIWHSPSADLLEDLVGPPQHIVPGQAAFAELHAHGGKYYLYQYDVSWEGHARDSSRYRFSIVHTQQDLRAALNAYRKQLWWLVVSLVALLLLSQIWIIRWGLRPLKTLAANLRAVKEGRASHLLGNYPKEIQPVTDNLNQVLDSESRQRERYRNTLGDLAHSLKTPLAVLRGSLNQPEHELHAQLDEQVQRMDQIISHQLRRAVLSTDVHPARRVNIGSTAARIGDALQKVYVDKEINLTINAADGIYFYGDEADLMEVLGNVTDNAFKYATKKVQIDVDAGNNDLCIAVSDDGPGIAAAMKDQILVRGARADTVKPGHGIGLAVVADIVQSYGGRIEIATAALGGARFMVVLPEKYKAHH